MANSPVLSRRTLGTELRRLREAAGVAVSRAAEELDCSVSKISRIETGLSTPRRPEIDTLLRLYEAPDARDELVQLAGEGKQAAWYDAYGDLLAPGSTLHRFIGLEAGAAQVRSYSSGAVPGLLQTERYARAIVTASQPAVSEEALETMIRMRLDRQRVLTRQPRPLRIAALVDEAVLRRPAHGPGVMREQVEELCRIVEEGSPTVELRVLPFAVGLHGLLGGAFQILSFDHGESDVILFEGQDGGGLQEKSDIVRAHADRLDTAWKQGIEGRELLRFLREVADTYDEEAPEGTRTARPSGRRRAGESRSTAVRSPGRALEGWAVDGAGRELEFVGREFCSIGDCVEAARFPDGRVAIRSSLTPDAPLCVVTAGEWARFLDTVKAGGFDTV